MPTYSIKLPYSERRIGDASPCFLIAEVGINHNGDMALAHKLIQAAKQCGADAVKFQNYRTEDFLSDRTLLHTYTSANGSITEPQWDMFKRYELTFDQLKQLKIWCDQIGMIFLSTPTSESGVADLVRLQVPLLKNGSDYLVHTPLVRAMARTGLTTLLSLGMATAAEMDTAVRAYRSEGNGGLVLLHCTSSYPTPAADVHLRKIPTLRAAFGALVGLSDHTDGIAAGIAACALGSCVIEKHFTLDKALLGPDHAFSCDPAEMAQLVQAVRTTESALGQAALGPSQSESLGRRDYRLSCVTTRALSAGHILAAQDVTYRRPGTGIPPDHTYLLLGRKLSTDLAAGTMLQIAQLAP